MHLFLLLNLTLKYRMKKYILTVLTFIICVNIQLSAQVGVGTDAPEDSSLLEVNSRTAGALISRLSEKEQERITTPVEGLLTYNITDNCLNFYNGEKWKKMCGDASPANFAKIRTGTDACNSWQSAFNNSGRYIQGNPITSGNTVYLPIEITSQGSLNIIVQSSNGYTFSYYSPMVGVGDQLIALKAGGTPQNVGTDTLKLTINGQEQTCYPTITVESNVPPVYVTVDCSKTKVNGRYIVSMDTNTSNNYISVTMVNTSNRNSYSYNLYTDTIDGVSFSATGTIKAAQTLVVNLTPTGTFTTEGTKNFTIKSNSTMEITNCDAAVKVEEIMRTINILGLGGGVYQPGTASNDIASRAILQNTSNFGSTADSKILVQSINIVNGDYNQGTALQTLITNNNIDIVIIGYNYLPNDQSITILTDMIRNNKPVIHSQETGETGIQSIMNNLFGTTTVTATAASPSLLNPFTDADSPILNGPFMDLRNVTGATNILYAGNDVNNADYVYNLPSNAIILAKNNGNDTVWGVQHPTLPYVFFGDSGWMTGTVTNTDTTTYPAAMNPLGIPASKTFVGGTVYNSYLYANAVAWAIDWVHNHDTQ